MRAGTYEREQASAFFGGYVLRIDHQDKYFPQCCGDLSDIHYWEKLANGKDGFYAGHPQPNVKVDTNIITLDFTVEEFDELKFRNPVTFIVGENGTKLIAYQDTEQYKLMKYFMNNHERILSELGFDF
ncbi:hypothetical protein [Sphingobacterium puteale]|uniref:hypothetical protein n=1 Tax=Sphingobacterium puteale TaxID=2420510 RepID=UPI003D95CFD5